MKRRIMQDLLDWKNSSRRKPLLINGARQVGKTYILKEFAENEYENYVYINVENNAALQKQFESSLNPFEAISYLEVLSGQRIQPKKTLVILDEIQSSERALHAMKYFNEEANDYHVVCAGSLLGVAINRDGYSFPVGKIQQLEMYPMDFEEFLQALGKEILIEKIVHSFEKDEKLPRAIHEDALDLYRTYLVVGGMPEAVKIYIEEESYLPVQETQAQILSDYLADMAKYSSPSEAVKIRAAYESIPKQLAKENRKFQYRTAMHGGTANKFENALEWLRYAGIVLKCAKAENLSVPLAVYLSDTDFKIYMSDVGLLVNKSATPLALMSKIGEENNSFLGAITENYVAQQFASKKLQASYWKKEKGEMEIDFVIQKEESIIPIEVKSGRRTKSKTLNYLKESGVSEISYRISMKNFGCENGIKSVPLYAVFCIE